MIIRNGYIVAEWGEPLRVDMTHSVTKSFLSTVVGLAFDRRLIRSLQDKAIDYNAPVVTYKPFQRYDVGEEFGTPKFLDLFATEHKKRSHGNICLAKQAIGKARCGASPIGPIAPTAIRVNG
jgi:hypothetical protein